MKAIDWMLWFEPLWKAVVEFAGARWAELTALLSELWRIWTMAFPSDPIWNPYGSAIVLLIAFTMLLKYLPKERY